MTKLKKEEQAIHNYLVSLYAQHAENQLMKYLLSEGEVSHLLDSSKEGRAVSSTEFDLTQPS